MPSCLDSSVVLDCLANLDRIDFEGFLLGQLCCSGWLIFSWLCSVCFSNHLSLFRGCLKFDLLGITKVYIYICLYMIYVYII